MADVWKQVKVFGIERSGTVFVQSLFQENFTNGGILSNHFGSKHLPVEDTEEWLKKPEAEPWAVETYEQHKKTGIGFIIVIKNPYYWLQSIRAWRQRHEQEFDINSEMRRYNDLYLDFYDKLIEHDHPFFRHGCIIDYHNLINHTGARMNDFAQVYGLQRRAELIIPPKVDLSNEFTPERRALYTRPITLLVDEIASINDNISDELFIKYRYKRWNAA